jgi:hypothetical protein
MIEATWRWIGVVVVLDVGRGLAVVVMVVVAARSW